MGTTLPCKEESARCLPHSIFPPTRFLLRFLAASVPQSRPQNPIAASPSMAPHICNFPAKCDAAFGDVGAEFDAVGVGPVAVAEALVAPVPLAVTVVAAVVVGPQARIPSVPGSPGTPVGRRQRHGMQEVDWKLGRYRVIILVRIERGRLEVVESKVREGITFRSITSRDPGHSWVAGFAARHTRGCCRGLRSWEQTCK